MKVKTVKGFRNVRNILGWVCSNQGEELGIPYEGDKQVFHFIELYKRYAVVSDGNHLVIDAYDDCTQFIRVYKRRVSAKIVRSVAEKLSKFVRKNRSYDELCDFLKPFGIEGC